MDHDRLGVAMYAPSAEGGHARYCHELLSAIAALHDPTPLDLLLVTSENLDDVYRTAEYDIEAFLPPLARREQFGSDFQWAISRVTHYAKREHSFLEWLRHTGRCGVVHLQEYTPWLAVRDIAVMRRLGNRVIITVHDIRPHRYPGGIPSRLWDSWDRSAWRACDALFVHSQGLSTQLAEFLGPGHPEIVVVPHGIWSQTGTAERESGRLTRRLLFYGQVRRSKGLSVLLEALRDLPGCTLTVAGEPETPSYRTAVRSAVSRFDPGRVTLRDEFIAEADVPALFQEADLVVLPYTDFSAQSGVLHDAIAFGRPVVVTDVGALGESVRQWGIGQVARPNDPVDLARAINAALGPAAYAAAVEALAPVRRDFSWSRAARVTSDTYRRVWCDG